MRKILHIFLSLVIVYASTTSAFASTSVGGWTATDSIIAGANTTINAVKGAGATGLKSAVTVGASAAKVGSYLMKGAGGVALAYAVVELLGEGIDWVLDPTNNSVRYKDPSASSGDPAEGGGYYANYAGSTYYNPTDFCHAYGIGRGKSESELVGSYGLQSGSYFNCYYADGGRFGSYKTTGNDGGAGAGASGDYKYIPIQTVASKVIANAEAGHVPSQESVKAVALEGFAAGEHDAALNAAAVPDTGVENPPDTTDPENPPTPTDPAVPFDPSSIIAAINALKALLAGILSSITGLTDFFNSDTPPEKSQSETDVPVDDLPPTKSASEFDVDYINFGGQCPVLPSFSVGIGSASSAMTFDMTPLCDLAVTIRPAIIAIAYFIGLGVIASAIRET